MTANGGNYGILYKSAFDFEFARSRVICSRRRRRLRVPLANVHLQCVSPRNRRAESSEGEEEGGKNKARIRQEIAYVFSCNVAPILCILLKSSRLPFMHLTLSLLVLAFYSLMQVHTPLLFEMKRVVTQEEQLLIQLQVNSISILF